MAFLVNSLYICIGTGFLGKFYIYTSKILFINRQGVWCPYHMIHFLSRSVFHISNNVFCNLYLVWPRFSVEIGAFWVQKRGFQAIQPLGSSRMAKKALRWFWSIYFNFYSCFQNLFLKKVHFEKSTWYFWKWGVFVTPWRKKASSWNFYIGW
jgi:hypothetical protein